MSATTELKRPDLTKRTRLSNFILTEFKADKDCKNCFGTGIMIFQRYPGADFEYLPCKCLR